jgi:pimeloyl-ACP methyl ester carboxylesterase
MCLLKAGDVFSRNAGREKIRLPIGVAVLRLFGPELIFVSLAYGVASRAQEWKDESPHRQEMLKANGVKLHCLDWGGQGETILFLAGLGSTAHIFDELAPELTNDFRVLAMTRRGFGQSEKPANGYDATNLVNDIAGLMDALKVDRVILAGHSLAGQEMTRFAVKYPQRVRRLVYLDAAYDYSLGRDVIMRFQALLPRPTKEDQETFSRLLDWHRTHSPAWNRASENDFRATRLTERNDYTAKESAPNEIQQALITALVLADAPEFTKVQAPVLAIFADHDLATLLSHAEDSKRQAPRKLSKP